ncbi:GNAT family N-acetyltransferase [Taibaiella chishuiensis]|nr:GNAT family N-acetyltransferase [Taibaiella chishuiensis]
MAHTLRFATLEQVAAAQLTTVFNAAFAEYFVPIQLNTEQLQQKLINDSVVLSLSAGAFDGDELVGFILHGADTVQGEFTVYNAGTGVLPAYRGRQVTQAMYRFILPVLKARGAAKALLEVIDKNEPAIKSYKATGYTQQREFLCFKGTPQLPGAGNWEVQEIQQPDWAYMQTFWDWQPAWQNGQTALRNAGSAYRIAGICEGDRLVAYAAYNQQNRIAQFAVDKAYRGRGLATALFRHISQDGTKPVTLVNIPADAGATLAFLERAGLEMFIRQYEMAMPLS